MILTVDRHQQNGLMVACCKGFVDIVYGLHNCPFMDINQQDNEGNTALMIASQAGKSYLHTKNKTSTTQARELPLISFNLILIQTLHLSLWSETFWRTSLKMSHIFWLIFWFSDPFFVSRSCQHSHVPPKLLSWYRHRNKGLSRVHSPHQGCYDRPQWRRLCPRYGWYVRTGAPC